MLLLLSNPNSELLQIPKSEFKQANITYKDSSKYCGRIIENTKQRHGYGTLSRKEGNLKFEYKGYFDHDMFGDGPGELNVIGKLHFQGSFKQNKYDGYGTLKVDDNSTYSGHFLLGKRHGVGKQETDLFTFEGSWENDSMMQGPGTLYDKINKQETRGHINHSLPLSFYSPV